MDPDRLPPALEEPSVRVPRSAIGPASPSAEASRARIKETALRLFSQRGIDGVSVRDIVSAAEMKNGASLHYYFGTKEALIHELIIDCAVRSDMARLRRLEALEAAGGPRELADVVRVLIESELSLEENGRPGQMRFIMALQINHRKLVLSSLNSSEHAAGYMRCVEHIRRFLGHMPPEAVRNRVILMYLYIMTTLAAREAALSSSAEDAGLWNSPEAIETVIATTTALLEAPETPARA